MKSKILGLLAVGLLAGPVASNATTFNVSLSQTGLGDDSADWFGTFEAPESGGSVSSADILINGNRFVMPLSVGGPPQLSTTNILTGFFSTGPIGASPVPIVWFYFVSGQTRWALGTADSGGGATGRDMGFAVISRSVPEPGTLALLGLGLAGLGLSRRRKAN